MSSTFIGNQCCSLNISEIYRFESTSYYSTELVVFHVSTTAPFWGGNLWQCLWLPAAAATAMLCTTTAADNVKIYIYERLIMFLGDFFEQLAINAQGADILELPMEIC